MCRPGARTVNASAAMAAMPLENATAASAPSRSARERSNAATVGLPTRLYRYPSSSPANRRSPRANERYPNVEVCTMGVACAPVVGSRPAPACTARVPIRFSLMPEGTTPAAFAARWVRAHRYTRTPSPYGGTGRKTGRGSGGFVDPEHFVRAHRNGTGLDRAAAQQLAPAALHTDRRVPPGQLLHAGDGPVLGAAPNREHALRSVQHGGRCAGMERGPTPPGPQQPPQRG